MSPQPLSRTSETGWNETPRPPEAFIHLATPGDRYAPSHGSAISTVIYEISRCHEAAGGETTVFLQHSNARRYPVGNCRSVSLPVFGRLQKLQDAVFGRLGRVRQYTELTYRASLAAIPADFCGAIFVHNAPGAICGVKRRHPRATVCLWAHNRLFTRYGQTETERIVSTADRILCCSQFIADDLAARIRTCRERIRIVTGGVDSDCFRPDLTGNLDGVPTILFIGRVAPEKGPDLLIHAAIQLMKSKRNFRLRIVGSHGLSPADTLTPFETSLRRLTAPLGEAVEFRPFVDRSEVVAAYQSASILCVPSKWEEPFSLAVLEGMACGLPVIASERGGIREAGGDAALYIDPRDTRRLAACLAGLLEDPTLRAEWGARARARAVHMTWERSYSALLAALTEA